MSSKAPGIEILVDKVNAVIEGIQKLALNRVLVGIPSDRTNRADGEITNAALGYIHENGAPEVGIPARPFLVPGVKDAQGTTIIGMRAATDAAFEGRPAEVTRQFNKVGLQAVNAVKARINAGPPPPLKPGTIAARKRRGRTGTKPLIDTGQLRNAITYVIRGPGE